MFDDLRSFIDKLEEEAELVKVKTEVDWNLEIGAITRRAIDLRAPAPHFLKVKGYPRGYSVLGSIFGPTRPHHQGRLGLAMGLEKDTPPAELVEEFRRRIRKPISPVRRRSGECKEKVQKGKSVDLLKFPSPIIHRGDGGRYIGTWSICVTGDPSTGWVNWGIYRCMVHDSKTLGILLHPSGQHGGRMYYHDYEPRDEPMPIAIAVGSDPISNLAASTSFPPGVQHADMAGALRGRSVELVKCETNDLLVPASTEIVIEGVIPPRKRKLEGPFGEYTGYMSTGRTRLPYVEVKCITHREDPVLPIANMGKLWDECAVVNSVAESAVAAEVLQRNGIAFKSVYLMPPKSIVVSAESNPNLVHKISSALWGSGCRTAGEFIFVVGEDVDVTNLEEVWWCLTTRFHPERGMSILRNTDIDPLVPIWSPEERRRRSGVKASIDATFPADWNAEYLEAHTKVIDFESWPEAVRSRVVRNWSKYGYKANQ